MAQVAVIVLGIVVLIAGVFCSAYSTTTSYLWGAYSTTAYPLQQYGMPLILAGIVIAAIGAALPRK